MGSDWPEAGYRQAEKTGGSIIVSNKQSPAQLHSTFVVAHPHGDEVVTLVSGSDDGPTGD
jgi:hypothetical protein